MTTIRRKRQRLIAKIEALPGKGTLYITDDNGGFGGAIVKISKRTLLKLLKDIVIDIETIDPRSVVEDES